MNKKRTVARRLRAKQGTEALAALEDMGLPSAGELSGLMSLKRIASISGVKIHYETKSKHIIQGEEKKNSRAFCKAWTTVMCAASHILKDNPRITGIVKASGSTADVFVACCVGPGPLSDLTPKEKLSVMDAMRILDPEVILRKPNGPNFYDRRRSGADLPEPKDVMPAWVFSGLVKDAGANFVPDDVLSDARCTSEFMLNLIKMESDVNLAFFFDLLKELEKRGLKKEVFDLKAQNKALSNVIHIVSWLSRNNLSRDYLHERMTNLSKVLGGIIDVSEHDPEKWGKAFLRLAREAFARGVQNAQSAATKEDRRDITLATASILDFLPWPETLNREKLSSELLSAVKLYLDREEREGYSLHKEWLSLTEKNDFEKTAVMSSERKDRRRI